ncbi:hypothetical protein LG299_14145 [Microbacterium lacus]|uniref:hypothetical protein n=1 Tax=Microbacterium lacus TaxID=415217 RepID=UPI003850FB42
MSEATRHNFAPEGSGSAGLSRRQVVKAGVWAAPVVALAAAAPAAASSSGRIVVTSISAGSDTTSPWTVVVRVQSNEAASGTLTLTHSGGNLTISPEQGAISLPSAGVQDLTFTVTKNGNQARVLTVTPVVSSIPVANRVALAVSVNGGSTINATQSF